jgi:hypothetical protein
VPNQTSAPNQFTSKIASYIHHPDVASVAIPPRLLDVSQFIADEQRHHLHHLHRLQCFVVLDYWIIAAQQYDVPLFGQFAQTGFTSYRPFSYTTTCVAFCHFSYVYRAQHTRAKGPHGSFAQSHATLALIHHVDIMPSLSLQLRCRSHSSSPSR